MFNKKKKYLIFAKSLNLYQIKYGVQISHFCGNVILLVIITNSLLCENSDLQCILYEYNS